MNRVQHIFSDSLVADLYKSQSINLERYNTFCANLFTDGVSENKGQHMFFFNVNEVAKNIFIKHEFKHDVDGIKSFAQTN